MKRAALKPGWKMTPEQHRLFWRLWTAACAWQGWPSQDCEEKRREILTALGFDSAKEIDSTRGFDAVKSRLMELAGKVVNETPDAGERRRILSRVGLALGELGQADYPQAALHRILRERFHVIEGEGTIADLPTVELLNLVRTLTARLAGWQKKREALAA